MSLELKQVVMQIQRMTEWLKLSIRDKPDTGLALTTLALLTLPENKLQKY